MKFNQKKKNNLELIIQIKLNRMNKFFTYVLNVLQTYMIQNHTYMYLAYSATLKNCEQIQI